MIRDVWEHSHFQPLSTTTQLAVKSNVEWKDPGSNVIKMESGPTWDSATWAFKLTPAVWLDVNKDWTPRNLNLTQAPDAQINIVKWRRARDVPLVQEAPLSRKFGPPRKQRLSASMSS